VLNIAIILTIKKYFSKNVLTNHSLFNLFIILFFFVQNSNEWNKFSYNCNVTSCKTFYDVLFSIVNNKISKVFFTLNLTKCYVFLLTI